VVFYAWLLIAALFAFHYTFCAEDLGLEQRKNFVINLNLKLKEITGETTVEFLKNKMQKIKDKQNEMQNNNFFSDEALNSCISKGLDIYSEADFVYSEDKKNSIKDMKSELYKVRPPLLYFFSVDGLIARINFFQSCFDYIENLETTKLMELYTWSYGLVETEKAKDVYQFFRQQYPNDFSIKLLNDYSIKNKETLLKCREDAIEWLNSVEKYLKDNKLKLDEYKNEFNIFANYVKQQPFGVGPLEIVKLMETPGYFFHTLFQFFQKAKKIPFFQSVGQEEGNPFTFYGSVRDFLLYYAEAFQDQKVYMHPRKDDTELTIIRKLISNTKIGEYGEYFELAGDQANDQKTQFVEKLEEFFSKIAQFLEPIMLKYSGIQLYEIALTREILRETETLFYQSEMELLWGPGGEEKTSFNRKEEQELEAETEKAELTKKAIEAQENENDALYLQLNAKEENKKNYIANQRKANFITLGLMGLGSFSIVAGLGYLGYKYPAARNKLMSYVLKIDEHSKVEEGPLLYPIIGGLLWTYFIGKDKLYNLLYGAVLKRLSR